MGGQPYVLAILPIALSDEWKQLVAERAGNLWDGIDALESLGDVLGYFGSIEYTVLLELLLAYDRYDVLPQEHEWWRQNATEHAVLRGFIEVFAVANPTLAVLLDTMVRAPQAIATALPALTERLPERMSGSQPSTDGPAGTSGES